MKIPFFVGSYTEFIVPEFGGIGKGIYTVELNTETGALKKLHEEFVQNPSYLVISKDNRFLYCCTEVVESKKPTVRAYAINTDFSLTFINEREISGGLPCHINIHNKSLLVACYGSGNVIQYPLDVEIAEKTKEYHHKGTSINKARQEAPHAHQVAVHPNQKDIYVCDLGIDVVKAYSIENDMLKTNSYKDCEVTKGGGPRHLVFNKEGDIGYVLNELTADISVLAIADGVFKEIAKYPSLPAEYKGIPSASAIRIHPNGKYIFAANRSAELIAVFSVLGTKLSLVTHQYTEGKEIREFNITPDGKWLIACHQNSHDTVVYKIREDGSLSENYRTKEMLSPVCISFLNDM